MVINPPWWWHAVENIAEADELVIGVPTRFDSPKRALRADAFKTVVAAIRHYQHKPGFSTRAGAEEEAVAFERTLIENRDQTYQSLAL